MNILDIHNFSLSIENKILFDPISFSVLCGQHISILGRSGCGKSSLLKTICGLDTNLVKKGSIYCDIKNIAYMSQQDALLPWLSVKKNILLSLSLHHQKLNTEYLDKLKKLLQMIQLSEYADHYPHQLSGGQRQRVALARTLMMDAPLVLMDEPFSALDAITRDELQRLGSDLLSDKTVIFVTHDLQEAICLSDKILVLRTDGLIDFVPHKKRPRFNDEDQRNHQLKKQLLVALG